MATTVANSLQFQGNFLPYRNLGFVNSTTSSASSTIKSERPLSSDLFCISDRYWKSGMVVVVKSGNRRTIAASAATDDRVDLDGNPEGIISGEWPENFSLLSYEDLKAYLEPQVFKEKTKPDALLADVMSTPIRAATADQALEEINHHFEFVSGLPVIDDQLRCIGVVSKKDEARATNGLKSKVGEVMSSPAITLSPEKTVLDAATLMLKMKIHRIPIVNMENQVIGIVARTDVFKALESVKV